MASNEGTVIYINSEDLRPNGSRRWDDLLRSMRSTVSALMSAGGHLRWAAQTLVPRSIEDIVARSKLKDVLATCYGAIGEYFLQRGHHLSGIQEHIDSDELLKRQTMAFLMATFCAKFNIPIERGEHACLVLLGEMLPYRAGAKWSDRSGDDRQLSPIEFLQKYWGSYIDKKLMYQVDLRVLDNSLFEAVKLYARRRKVDPKTVLPPRHESRLERPLVDGMRALMAEMATTAEVSPEHPQGGRLPGQRPVPEHQLHHG
jgi:hypothetical protein